MSLFAQIGAYIDSLVHRSARGEVVVDVAGVGYRVSVSPATASRTLVRDVLFIRLFTRCWRMPLRDLSTSSKPTAACYGNIDRAHYSKCDGERRSKTR